MDQADRDDARMLEAELTMVEGEPEVVREVRDDYAEIATSAGCPGYHAED